jgi:ABC-type Fe3+/spermidine/putrescine transport system ATPase subunit
VKLFDDAVSGPGFSVPAEHRGVAMVFQDHALFPHLRVAANVAFGLRGLPRAEQDRRVQEALALVGLPDLGGRWIHALSGGQRQRVALARALAPGPRVLLLDEPLSSLDERLRGALRDDIARLLRDRGTTTLWVTHSAEDALTVADRAAVFEAGRLRQLDPPALLYRRPCSRSVARLFGPVNTVSEETARALAGDPSLEGPCLVRPEGLVVGASGLAATVTAHRFRGRDHLVTVTLVASGERLEVACAQAPERAASVAVGVRAGALLPDAESSGP